MALLALGAGRIALAASGVELPPAPLSLETAQKIAAKAAACAAKQNWRVSVAIVNAEGNLLYFQRGDGAYLGSIDMAIQKAKSANAFMRPTSAFTESVHKGRPELVGAPGILPIEGGVPIELGGRQIGAIGVSGAKSTEDEDCARAGLKI